jgi:hypothetical protein
MGRPGAVLPALVRREQPQQFAGCWSISPLCTATPRAVDQDYSGSSATVSLGRPVIVIAPPCEPGKVGRPIDRPVSWSMVSTTRIRRQIGHGQLLLQCRDVDTACAGERRQPRMGQQQRERTAGSSGGLCIVEVNEAWRVHVTNLKADRDRGR